MDAAAERCLPVQWPTLTASAYLQYREIGDRKQFETLAGKGSLSG